MARYIVTHCLYGPYGMGAMVRGHILDTTTGRTLCGKVPRYGYPGRWTQRYDNANLVLWPDRDCQQCVTKNAARAKGDQ